MSRGQRPTWQRWVEALEMLLDQTEQADSQFEQTRQKLASYQRVLEQTVQNSRRMHTFHESTAADKAKTTAVTLLAAMITPLPGSTEIWIASTAMLWLETEEAGRHVVVEHLEGDSLEAVLARFGSHPSEATEQVIKDWEARRRGLRGSLETPEDASGGVSGSSPSTEEVALPDANSVARETPGSDSPLGGGDGRESNSVAGVPNVVMANGGAAAVGKENKVEGSNERGRGEATEPVSLVHNATLRTVSLILSFKRQGESVSMVSQALAAHPVMKLLSSAAAKTGATAAKADEHILTVAPGEMLMVRHPPVPREAGEGFWKVQFAYGHGEQREKPVGESILVDGGVTSFVCVEDPCRVVNRPPAHRKAAPHLMEIRNTSMEPAEVSLVQTSPALLEVKAGSGEKGKLGKPLKLETSVMPGAALSLEPKPPDILAPKKGATKFGSRAERLSSAAGRSASKQEPSAPPGTSASTRGELGGAPEDFFAVELSHIGKKSKIEVRRGQMLLIEGAA